MQALKGITPVATQRAEAQDVDECVRRKVVLGLVAALELVNFVEGTLRLRDLRLENEHVVGRDLGREEQVEVLDVLHPGNPHGITCVHVLLEKLHTVTNAHRYVRYKGDTREIHGGCSRDTHEIRGV